MLGGSGFIGSKVSSLLSKRGRDPIVCDVVQSNITADSPKWAKADILDSLSLERLLLEYDIGSIIHLIGLPVIERCEKNPQLSFALNVLSLQNTLEAMRKADVNRIVFASSAAVYGYSLERPVREDDPLNPNTIYGFHKLIGEKEIEAYSKSYGLQYTILRFFNVYGAHPSVGKDVISIFVRKALSSEPINVRGKAKFRDFIHVDDVSQIVSDLALGSASNGALNVGTGKRTTLGEVVEVMKGTFDKLQIIEEPSSDDGTGLVADTSSLSSSIDYIPKDSLEGIRDYVRMFSSSKEVAESG